MEPRLRGYMEQFLETQLEEEQLIQNYNYWKVRFDEGIIDSIKSSMIGEIYGKMLGIVTPASMLIGQYPTAEAVNEFHRMLDDKYPLIRSKIMKITER